MNFFNKTEIKLHNLKQDIKEYALQIGFADCKVTNEINYRNIENFYKDWLGRKFNDKMNFLERNLEKRFDLKNILPDAKSALVFSISYNFEQKINNEMKISRYALIKDYHKVIFEKLKKVDDFIKLRTTNYKSKIFVDTGPILEKQIAKKAGIGWQGRNSLIISKEYGSWIFLGVIIINLDLENDEKHPDYCGKCRLCIENCPTQAITENRNIDASKCIAYWTIESKEEIFPDFIRKNQNKWVYGCDICQEVCPWNKKAKIGNCKEFILNNDISNISKDILMNLNEELFNDLFKETPIARLGLKRLKRNIEGI